MKIWNWNEKKKINIQLKILDLVFFVLRKIFNDLYCNPDFEAVFDLTKTHLSTSISSSSLFFFCFCFFPFYNF